MKGGRESGFERERRNRVYGRNGGKEFLYFSILLLSGLLF
jgi:hypothetical protein